MTIERRGGFFYGASQSDLRGELERYAGAIGYPPSQFAEAVCVCGSREFTLTVDDDEGAAVRTCGACRAEHPIGDSADFLEDATLEECGCPCGGDLFEITVGLALYDDSAAARWLYLGCRCPKCGLVATYGDWKNEHEDYRELLAQV